MRGRYLLAAVALFQGGAGCTGRGDTGHARVVTVDVDTATLVATVDPRFISFAIDSAQVVGGRFWDPSASVGIEGVQENAPFDFARPRLRNLAAAFSPAYLRIGGTAADRVYFAPSPAETAGVEARPPGYRETMTSAMWDGVNQFAQAAGLEVFFTLNAGPGPRGENQRWRPDNARALIEYTVAKKYPVTVWELGNEVHGYPLFHRLDVAPEAFAADVATARTLLDELDPKARLTAPSSAYWPGIGEARPFLPAFLAAGGGDHLDFVSWHYYPQQSVRCPLATRRARPGLLLDPDNLGAIDRFIAEVATLAEKHRPGMRVWLGETGHAQCGGEPGVSDAYESGFWWLDQLGRLARAGQPVVIRQTLAGSNYGLLDARTLEPNPDYWSSLLWRRLMGTGVLAASSSDARLRVYAHCADPRAPRHHAGAITLALINLDAERTAEVRLPRLASSRADLYLLTAPAMRSRELSLNGAKLALSADGSPPPFSPLSSATEGVTRVALPPLTYGFVVLDANAQACL